MSRLSGFALALLALVSSATQAAEEELGRLFFTPQQRAALDAGRRIASEKISAAKPSNPGGLREVELNGIITRSDGERTVWVNGKAYHDRPPQGMRVNIDPRKPASAQVRLSSKRAPAELRVGQRLDTRTGAVSDRLTPARTGVAGAGARPSEQPDAPAVPKDKPDSAVATDNEERD